MAEDDAERRRDAERLRSLEAKLDARRRAEAPQPGAVGRSVDQANIAWRMVIELVAGLVMGFGIGLGLDWLFGTRPIMLLVFTLAGFAAGVKTMLRTARELNVPPQDDLPAVAGVDDDRREDD